MAVDVVLSRLAPAEPVPLSEAIAGARAALQSATRSLHDIDDAVLDRSWAFRDGEAEVRYGFFRLYEMLEDARADAERRLDSAGAGRSAAQPLLGAATAARWDLHGILESLGEGELDRDPGGGEWTLRQTIAHIIHSQRAYAWFTAWWLERRATPPNDYPTSVPDDAIPEWTDDETAEGTGTLTDLRARLDGMLDEAATVYAPLDEEALAVRARWSGAAVDVRFRIGRWSSHIREHTIQVEKTLAMLGRSPREVDRLIRLVYGAYGRFEALAFGRSADEVAPAADAFSRFGEDAPSWADEVRKAARTG